MILSRLTLPMATSERSSNKTIYAVLSSYSVLLTNPLTTYLSFLFTLSISLCHIMVPVFSRVGQNSSLDINLSGSMEILVMLSPIIFTAALLILSTSPSAQNTTAGYCTLLRKSI